MRITVPLHWSEWLQGSQAGCMRRITSKMNGRKDSFEGLNDWNIDVNGACAELALAKHYRLYFSPETNVFMIPDVGSWYVRSTHHLDGGLVVRPRDIKKGEFKDYVLVIIDMPVCHIMGWANAATVAQDKFLVKDRKGDYWCMPNDLLEPMP